MTELTYKIEVFEGPLDLLLSLIHKNKVDICDIPINEIFTQYMEYLDEMKKMDMDIAGEFIVMASELMFIKSKMLLPRPAENGEDPRAALAQALLEYKYIKEISEKLDEYQKEYEGRFVKETDEIPPDAGYVCPHNITLLKSAMIRMLEKRAEETRERPDNIRPIIKRKIVPVSAKIIGVMKTLKRGGKTHFDRLFESCTSKSELVAVFMAVLELLKVNRILIHETENTQFDPSDIIVELNCTP